MTTKPIKSKSLYRLQYSTNLGICIVWSMQQVRQLIRLFVPVK